MRDSHVFHKVVRPVGPAASRPDALRPHLHSPYDSCPQEKVSVVKISCSSSDLLAHLQTVARVASTRSAVQALSGVQLAAQDGGVELRATDMEVGLRVPLQAEVARPGISVLPARLTLDVVRALPAADVTVELPPSEGDVEITSGSATFHIRTLRLEDFPPLPEPGGDAVVGVPAQAFLGTVRGGGR